MLQSYKIKLVGLPMLTLFYFRNLVGVSDVCVRRVMEVVISCLADENIEVREMAKKVLSGLLRCSQRRQILPLRVCYIASYANRLALININIPPRIDS